MIGRAGDKALSRLGDLERRLKDDARESVSQFLDDRALFGRDGKSPARGLLTFGDDGFLALYVSAFTFIDSGCFTMLSM